MKPPQQPGIARSRAIRRDDQATHKTASLRSITEYDKWIEGIRSSEGQFGKPPGHRSPGAWSSRIILNSKSMPCNRDDESDELDVHQERVCSGLRVQKIEDYRKEMMDMVRGLPESDFELTLQDIVEKRKEFDNVDKEVEAPVKVEKELVRSNEEMKRKKNQRSYVIVERSKSIDAGLLARMFMPLSVVAEKKKKKKGSEGKKEKKSSKDEEWWKKNEFSEKGSNSSSVGSSTSNDSGGSSGGDDRFSRNMSMKQAKCSCFRPGKIKIRPGKMKPKSS